MVKRISTIQTSFSFCFRIFCFLLFFSSLIFLGPQVRAAGPSLLSTTPVEDDASDTVYDDGWQTGDDGGTGLGAWTLVTTSGNSGQNGHFMGGSDIATSGDTWCMYANSDQTASAIRPFDNTISVGQTVTWEMDNGYIDGPGFFSDAGNVGVGLVNSSGEPIFEVYFQGGDSNYTVNGLTEVDSGLGFTVDGIRVEMTLTSSSTYLAVITPLGGGLPVTLTGPLGNPAGGQTITDIRLFNDEAGNNVLFFPRDACYNSISVTDRTDDIILNEILSDPHAITPTNGQDCDGDMNFGEEGGAEDEFFELFNNTGEDIYVGSYCVADESGTPASNERWQIPDDPEYFIPAGGYLTICGGSSFRVDNSGTTTTIDAATGFSVDDDFMDEIVQFANSGEEFVMYPSTEADGCGIATTDAFIIEDIPSGAAQGESYQRCPNGTGSFGYYEFDGNFYYPTPGGSNCFATTPVTISYFNVQRNDDRTEFEWATSTETGNLGFNLYAVIDGERQLLTPGPIQSKQISSTESQAYSLTLKNVPSVEFYLEDIDYQGHVKEWGPFVAGIQYGEKPQKNLIDWGSIWAEHAEKEANRQAERRDVAQAYLDNLARTPISAETPLLQLNIDTVGIHQVTNADLQAAGFDLTGLNSAEIALIALGQPVPIVVNGGPVWNANSSIEFLGQPTKSLYADVTPYFVHVDASRASQISIDSTAPTGGVTTITQAKVGVNDNLEYDVTSPFSEPWYHTRLVANGGSLTKSLSFDVTHYAPNEGDVTLALQLWGGTDFPGEVDDHHVIVRVGDRVVADVWFNGLVSEQITATLTADELANGTNSLEIELPLDHGFLWDVVNVEGYGVEYPRQLTLVDGALQFGGSAETFTLGNVTTLPIVYRQGADGSLTKLTNIQIDTNTASFAGTAGNDTYFVQEPDALLTPAIAAARPVTDITSGTAQYLMISHPDFVADLAPLVDFHTNNGLDVRVIDVEDVYAQFGDGMFGAEAIRAYLQHAILTMQTEYVLLVGGDTYDYLQYKYNGLSFMPSLYQATGTIARWVPVDPAYVDIDVDGVPDAALGRFPVRNSAELSTIIQKTLTYEGLPANTTAIFASDLKDGSMDFENSSELFASLLPSGWNSSQFGLDSLAVADARTGLLDAINNGAALTTYLGHSGPTQWTWSGLFSTSDAQALTNEAHPTIFAQFGCWNTYYVSPLENTLGHFLMLDGAHGGAAVFGASTLTSEKSDVLLGQLLMAEFSQGEIRIGDALLNAKQALEAESSGLADVQYGWTLLGDPALTIGATMVPAAVEMGEQVVVSAETMPLLLLLLTLLGLITGIFVRSKRRLTQAI